jgi:excisionase family DNA binding protein
MESIKKEIAEIKSILLGQEAQKIEFLTVSEAAKHLQLSESRIYKMTSNKEIPHYSPGGKKIYFLKNELNDWVLESRIAPSEDFKAIVDNYLTNNN